MSRRPALQRLLAHPPALALLRENLGRTGLYRHEIAFTCQPCSQERSSSDCTIGRSTSFWESTAESHHEDLTDHKGSALGVRLSSKSQSQRPGPSWKKAGAITADGRPPNVIPEPIAVSDSLQLMQGEPETKETISADAFWTPFLEQIHTERRRRGARSANALFTAIAFDRLDTPTVGIKADQLWDTLLQSGFMDYPFLEDIIQHAEDVKNHTQRAWPNLYKIVMAYFLRLEPTSAIKWHRRLVWRFPPTKEHSEELFELSLMWGRPALKILEIIYKENPVQGMYSKVVRDLCKHKLYADATRWHYLLIKVGDTPHDFEACRLLLLNYLRNPGGNQFEKLAESLICAVPLLKDSVDELVRHNETVSRETLNRALGEAYGIAPKPISDGFCARLFATRPLTVDFVIGALRAIGTQSIGPASLRAMIVRDDCSASRISYHLNKLHEAGISLDNSKYTAILRKAAIEGRMKTLLSVTQCDLHPDAFEDTALQERLLASYHKQQDNEQFSRTMEVLLYQVPKANLDKHRLNILLRCYIATGDRAQAQLVFDFMLQQKVPVESASAILFRKEYLEPRFASKRPAHSLQGIQDLMTVINVMKHAIENGEKLPILAWREVLKRLGMLGRLTDYENLALWLVEMYAPRPLEPVTHTPFSSAKISDLRPPSSKLVARQTAFEDDLIFAKKASPHNLSLEAETVCGGRPGCASSVSETSLTVTDIAAPPERLLQIRHRLNHWSTLFNVAAQQSIVTWGFKSERRDYPIMLNDPKKVPEHSASDWQWGLRLLKTLKDRGVPIKQSAVARACKLRLIQLFDESGQSTRASNKDARVRHKQRAGRDAQYQYFGYIKGMQELWGKDFLDAIQIRDLHEKFGGDLRMSQIDGNLQDGPQFELSNLIEGKD